MDDRHLFVRNFRYDGTGPDAYFWVGDDAQPSPRGRIVPYPPQPVQNQPQGMDLNNFYRQNARDRQQDKKLVIINLDFFGSLRFAGGLIIKSILFIQGPIHSPFI